MQRSQPIAHTQSGWEACVERYEIAFEHLTEAFCRLGAAKAELDECFDSPEYRELCEKLEIVGANVVTASRAIRRTLDEAKAP